MKIMSDFKINYSTKTIYIKGSKPSYTITELYSYLSYKWEEEREREEKRKLRMKKLEKLNKIK